MTEQTDLRQLALDALDDLKAIDVRVLDVAKLTTITDHMIVASGRSDRHVRSLAQNVVTCAKQQGIQPVGVEGEKEGEWVLVDLGDVIVHVQTPRTRDFYNLEKLWDIDETPSAEPASAD
ncbi:MAG: ribosome silencing factor [Gammaproteobacteria bacterium]